MSSCRHSVVSSRQPYRARPAQPENVGDRLAAHVFQPGGSGADLMQLLTARRAQFRSLALGCSRPCASRCGCCGAAFELEKPNYWTSWRSSAKGPLARPLREPWPDWKPSSCSTSHVTKLESRCTGASPVLDGDALDDGRTYCGRKTKARRRAEKRARAECQRLSLGIKFSKTGPVRVDAWLRSDRLNLRVLSRARGSRRAHSNRRGLRWPPFCRQAIARCRSWVGVACTGRGGDRSSHGKTSTTCANTT